MIDNIVRFKRAVPPVVGFRAEVHDVVIHPTFGPRPALITGQVKYVTDGGRKFDTEHYRYHMLESNYEPEGEPDES